MSFFQPQSPSTIYLKGPVSYLPNRRVTNSDLIEWMGANIRESWIEHRTGIRERRWCEPHEACSDLAFYSASALFEEFPEERNQIRNLILATISGDHPVPPTSPLLQNRLGLQGIGAMDLGAACAGFVTGLHTACALLASTGQSQLLISADIRSKFLSPEDFATATLFGDGSAAAILSKNSEGADFRYLGSQLFSDGSIADIIGIEAGGSRLPYSADCKPEQTRLKMKKGALLFLKAAEGMAESARIFLENVKLPIHEVDWVVPHQANLHLVREVGRRLEVPSEKIIETVPFTGNTSGSSVGIALSDLRRRLRNDSLKGIPGNLAGQKVLLISAGGGGLAACALLETLAQRDGLV